MLITKEYADKVHGKVAKQLLANCFLEFKYSVGMHTSNNMFGVVMEKEMLDDRVWGELLYMYMGHRMNVDMSGDLNDADYFAYKISHLLEK